jgi:diguanylate cyclase (GGDEF)-like protein
MGRARLGLTGPWGERALGLLRRRSADGTRTLAVLLLVAGLAGVAALLTPAALATPLSDHDILPLPVLALAFTAAELSVRYLRVRRHATTLSLSELPLTMGLALTDPSSLLVARLIGSLTAFVGRRQAPVKILFNTVLALTETVGTIVLVRLLAGGESVLDPRGWAAVVAALTVVAVLGRAVVYVVVLLHEGASERRRVLADSAAVAGRAATCGVLGLAAAVVLAVKVQAGVLLAVAAVLVLAAHRRYAVLAESHERVERLYRFTSLTSTAGTVDAVIATSLRESLSLLRSEHAEVLLLPRAAASEPSGAVVGGTRLCVAMREGDPAPGPGTLQEADPLVADVLARRTGLVIPRRTQDARHRRFLDSYGLRDAVLVPLWSEGGVEGLLLLADRPGAVRSYGDGDRLLAESIAGQTGLALAAAHVVDRLQHDSLHDALTGLANRTLLNRWLSDAASDGSEGGHRPAVVLVDLDGFKLVNDTLGHARGDELLAWAARRLEGQAGPGGQVARLGGDEFAVVLHDEAEADVLARAGRMSRALRRTVRAGDLSVEVGGSIGVAFLVDGGVDPSDVLRRADAAMYAAKQAGGGVRVWTPDRLGPEAVLGADLRDRPLGGARR